MSEAVTVDPVLVASMLDYLRRHEHGADLAEMAEHFGVSSATALRIIEFLWTLEFPDTTVSGHQHMFDFDAEGLYAEEPWVKLVHDPATHVRRRFSPSELATVLIGLSSLREFRSAEEIGVLDRLSAKLLGTDLPGPGAGEIEDPTVAAIRRSIDRGTRLRIEYVSEHAVAPEARVVDPLRLEVRGAMAYLWAYCRLREGMRWFRRDRILTSTELDEPIAKYSEEDRNQVLRVRGESYPELQVAVAPSAFAAIRPYLDGRDFPALDADGFSRCRIVFRSLRVAARLAAENAGAFVVEAPDAARAFMVRWAREALRNRGSLSDPKA